MNRICLAGIVVLLALMAAACGGSLTPSDVDDTTKLGFAGYENGVEMVNIAIGGTGTGRALTDTTPRKDKIMFYEVAFKSGTTVYRKTWSKGGNTTLRVPVGTYDTADKAILFAGTSDKTLIAVGLLTGTSDGGPTNSTLTTSTTSVTFTLYTLQNDISLIVADSTFQGTGNMIAPGGTDFPHPNSLPTTPIHSFGVSQASTATYQIRIGALGVQTAKHNAGMIVALDTADTPFGVRDSTKLNDAGEVVTLDNLSFGYTGAAAAPATTFPTDGVFELGFTTPAEQGYAELFFNIKTYAISRATSGTDTPTEWFIKGGLDNESFDAGVGVDSEGGALLIAVGDAKEFVDVTVGSNP